MKGLFITALILTLFKGVNAKSFSELSSHKSVTITKSTTTEGYANIHVLAVNKNEDIDSIPIEVKVKIGEEVMTDYIILTGILNVDVKTLYLYEGDSVNVELKLLSDKNISISNIKGNIKFSDPMLIKNEASLRSKNLIGEYWDVKRSIMFKFNNTDSVTSLARFSVELNKNYPFDKFYYQINVLAPDSSFYSFEGKVDANKGMFLSLEDLKLNLTEEVGISKQGKYIIEVVPLMGIQRINGIKSIGYQLINI